MNYTYALLLYDVLQLCIADYNSAVAVCQARVLVRSLMIHHRSPASLCHVMTGLTRCAGNDRLDSSHAPALRWGTALGDTPKTPLNGDILPGSSGQAG